MSKNEGKIFEQYWKNSIPSDVYYLRIKDSATSFGQDSIYSRFTPSNPYDCFVFYNGFLFPMELKSTKLNSISIQRSKSDRNKMIKLNQINGLSDSNRFNNVLAGFVFDFRESDTYWLSIGNFIDFLSKNDKKSINKKDIIKYKGIKIEKIIKKTRYLYNIRNLLDKIMEEFGKDGKDNFLQ